MSSRKQESETASKTKKPTGTRSRGRPRPKVRKAQQLDTKSRRRPKRTARLGGSFPRDRKELEALSSALTWARVPRRTLEGPARVPFRRLHVLMVGWEFPPNHTGGLGVHCYELCKELTRMGHRVTFLTPFHGPFTPVEGVTFRFPGEVRSEEKETWYPPAYWTGAAPGSPFKDATDGYNAWVGALSGVSDVDIVHVHDWFGTKGAVALSRRLHRPLVMTVHSTEYDRSLGHPWKHIVDRELLGIEASNRVIAVSRHLRQQLIDRYGARPAKVRVIYNAVRPSERLAPLENSKDVVLYLGRLAAMKGVDTFLRAAARLSAEVPDTLFVVAGEGPEFPHLLNLAAHLGISDHVLFLGKVTEEERTLLLAGASVFVLPSVVEPFGIAALEAMAAGVPAIVSKTSGVSEITESVFLVDFWDIDEFASRIAELLHYPVLRREMGERGRWEALREGWPERALQTVGVYAELIRGPTNH